MMSRYSVSVGLVAITCLVLTPTVASAQFIGGSILNPLPGGFPFNNPWFNYHRYAYRGFTFATPWGGVITADRWYVGSTAGYYHFYNRLPYSYYATYQKYIPSSGSHSTGMVAMPAYKPLLMNPRAIGNMQAQAERNAQLMDGRKQVLDQVQMEKGGVGLKGVEEAARLATAPQLREALVAEALAADGQTLNTILAATIAAEKAGAKAPGVILAPELLASIRFGGTPAGEALNLLRFPNKLPFPALFDTDALKPFKEQIEKQFLLVAETAGSGKAIDQNRVARLSEIVQRARDRVSTLSRDQPFEESLAARRFLNDLDTVAKVLRDGAAVGLLNPLWETEGITVPELVRHMAKYKLQFAPASKDGVDAYAALHRGLAAYYTALTENRTAAR